VVAERDGCEFTAHTAVIPGLFGVKDQLTDEPSCPAGMIVARSDDWNPASTVSEAGSLKVKSPGPVTGPQV
jgi:hypothetical protein